MLPRSSKYYYILKIKKRQVVLLDFKNFVISHKESPRRLAGVGGGTFIAMSIVKFLECIPTEISVAIIGVLSVVVSSFLSIHISKATTIAEISAEKERREDTWKHEQESAYNAEFANMVTAVTAYLNEQTKENYGKAIEALNIIRVKEPTELSRRLDMLYYLITDKYDVELKLQQLEMELTNAVEQKRNNNCQYTAANH